MKSNFRKISHSTALRGGGCHHSSKSSRGKHLDIEEPVSGRYASCGAQKFSPHDCWTPSCLDATIYKNDNPCCGRTPFRCAHCCLSSPTSHRRPLHCACFLLICSISCGCVCALLQLWRPKTCSCANSSLCTRSGRGFRVEPVVTQPAAG